MSSRLGKYLRPFLFLRNNGISGASNKVAYRFLPQDKIYKAWFAKNAVSDKETEEQRKHKFTYMPKLSVITSLYNVEPKYLDKFLHSLKAQTYDNWEAHLFFEKSLDIDSTLERALVRKYFTENKYNFQPHKSHGLKAVPILNKAISVSEGQYLVYIDAHDVLEPDAFFEIVSYLQDFQYDFMYSDNDYISLDQKSHVNPCFKPGWSIDQIRSHNYIGRFFVCKTDIALSVGGFDAVANSSYVYDFVLKAAHRSRSICRIPRILYHQRKFDHDSSYDYDNDRKVLQNFFDNHNIDAFVSAHKDERFNDINYFVHDNPLVTIIICTKDSLDVLKPCIDSLYKINTYKNFELIICSNDSEDKDTFKYFARLQKHLRNVKVVTYDIDFNYAEINNYAAKFAHGKFLLFLNNDTRLIQPDSIRDMLGICQRSEVGAVGAKLLYEDNTIQHGGVTLGWPNIARHMFCGIDKDAPGYMMRPQILCNYSAVTGACLMTKTSYFRQLKGFDEEFAVGLNDVDYCLRLRRKGKFIVYDPKSVWFHFESKTRGHDNFGEKRLRYEKESKLFRERWNNIFEYGDPFYNPNFSFDLEPYKIKY